MIVVSDTTPIISLLKINHLDLLQTIFGTVKIPRGVFAELTTNKKFAAEAKRVQQASYIEILDSADNTQIEQFRAETGLDEGESEAILLAEKINADLLLMDELRGRMVATKRGLRITGLIGILGYGAEHKLLSKTELAKSIEILRKSGRHISEDLFRLLQK